MLGKKQSLHPKSLQNVCESLGPATGQEEQRKQMAVGLKQDLLSQMFCLLVLFFVQINVKARLISL